jgi:hypothetical protein
MKTAAQKYLVRSRYGWGWEVIANDKGWRTDPIEFRWLAEAIAAKLNEGQPYSKAIIAAGGRFSKADGQVYSNKDRIEIRSLTRAHI